MRSVTWMAVLVATLAMSSSSRAMELCDDGDTIVFSCTFKNSKVVSVCRKHLKEVYYRYGKYGKIEFDYPGGSVDAVFTRQQLDVPGGKENILSFEPADGVHFNVDSIVTSTTSTATALIEHDVKLVCHDHIDAMWEDLDQALPPTPPPPAKGGTSATGKLVCADGATALTGQRRKIADVFRAFAEKKHKFYEFAVAQFGPPQSCAFDMTGTGFIPPKGFDETSYVGKLSYVFKGATLVVASNSGIDAVLSAPDGFKSVAQATKALEKAAFSTFKGMEPEKSEDAKAGTRTLHYQTEEDESVAADLIYRGPKLVALHTNW